MCGLAGYLRYGHDAHGLDTVWRMTRALAHRGPDDEGFAFIDTTSGRACELTSADSARAYAPRLPARADVIGRHRIAMGHRRFSINDLSPRGHQPFWSEDLDICLTFHGEIYNHVELRRELETAGHRFHTSCDTEVLLEAYRAWGTTCFERLRGFWAVALYDARHQGLLLARDRMGKAPLYVARRHGALWWSSEIKGVLAGLGGARPSVRDQAVSDFLVHGYRDVHHETFYDGLTSFPNAAFAWVRPDGTIRPQPYWRLPRARLTERDLPPKDAAWELRTRLQDALRVRLRADVPVAAELSGGMDSSALVALAAEAGSAPESYTASFPGTEADELHFARLVALGVRSTHHEIALRGAIESVLAQADAYAGFMDEPFHSPSMVVNQQIWRAMAARGIRVSLNGAAGDELLAGYPGVYFRPFLAHGLRTLRVLTVHRACTGFSEAPAPPWSRASLSRWADACKGLARLAFPAVATRRAARRSRGRRDGELLSLGVAPRSRPISGLHDLLIENMTDWQMNYWLRSGGQSAMGVPIEVRAPFLDHHVVEFAFSLPVTYLIRDGWLKWILREAVKDLLPREVVWRRQKMGFPFPIEQWLLLSRAELLAMVEPIECPYVSHGALRAQYEVLARTDPMFLWRVISLCLWWRRCVQDPSLETARLAA